MSTVSSSFTRSGCPKRSGSHVDYPRHHSYISNITICSLRGLVPQWEQIHFQLLSPAEQPHGTLLILKCKGLVRKYSPKTLALDPTQTVQFVPAATQTLLGDLTHILRHFLQGALLSSLLHIHTQHTKCKQSSRKLPESTHY